jgi:hypothetical protein
MKYYLRIFIYSGLPTLLFSLTWAPVEKTCPICGTTGRYYEVMNYGSYVFDYPSRFEYIYWPYTDGKALYSCRKCWFTCFLWDFEEIPQDKIEDIRRFVDSLDLYETNGDYFVIPMSYRLFIAERIYKILGKDREFWCHFYRVKGHHLANEQKTAHAAEARTQALGLAEDMLQDKANISIQKELYIIAGAMKYHLNDLQGALSDFSKARALTFKSEKWSEENLENINLYLSRLTDEFVDKIQERKGRAVFSKMPTISELLKNPDIFVDSTITLTGKMVNQGTGYYKDFKPALEDTLKNALSVTIWAPLELPPPQDPDRSLPKVMGYYLDKKIRAGGYLRRDSSDRFNGDYYFEVFDAQVVDD